jgi:probable O-glycosylation ligase (exosortase A-associated)
MLRAIFVLAAITIGLRYCVRGAFYVLLFYLWVAYFRPEQWLWWDFVTQFNLSFIVGIGLVLSSIFSVEKWRGGFRPTLLGLLLAQTLFSTLASPAFDVAWPGWTEFARILTVSYLIFVLVTTEERLRLAVLVIAFSLGFEGAKQGWANLILHPGSINENAINVFGDNNGVAVAMLMLVPLFVALGRTAQNKKEKYLERFFALGVLYRALSTYSRGGFLASLALGILYLFRAKRKVASIVAIAVVLLVVVPVLPNAFWQRMSTIMTAADETTEVSDVSAQGRLYFWQIAVAMANDRPLTGVGPKAYSAMYNNYATSEFGSSRAVHSSWFGMLAEGGYVALALFITVIAAAFYECRVVRRLAKARPDMASLGHFAAAFEASLAVFCVGGSFVTFHLIEVLWHFVALSFVVGGLARAKSRLPVPSPQFMKSNSPVGTARLGLV